MEKCPFCKSENLVAFHEHYTFCKECTAIYTYYIIRDSKINCEHITKNTVCADRPPWFRNIREATVYIEQTVESHACSVCGAEVIPDGW